MSTVAHEHDHHHAPTGLKRWIFSTNHKDIGTLYLIFSLMMFFIGGAMAMIIGLNYFNRDYNLLIHNFITQWLPFMPSS